MDFWTVFRIIIRILSILIAHEPTPGDKSAACSLDLDGDGIPDIQK